MGRPKRIARGNIVYHVLNRANGHLRIFKMQQAMGQSNVSDIRAGIDNATQKTKKRFPAPLLQKKTAISFHRSSGQTLNELLVVIMAVIFLSFGFLKGIQIGREYGLAWAIIGGIVGPVVGIVLTVALVLVIALIYEPFNIFGRWWRPHPPICENGKCVGYESYEICGIPDDIQKTCEGFSPISYRCGCGNLYGSKRGLRGQRQWVRIFPDGSHQPYLKHSAYGRWKSDDAAQSSSAIGGSGIKYKSISKKDLEKCLHQSKRAMVGHVIVTLVTVIAAFVVWKISSPRWWIYLLIVWVGPFGLIGDFINIWYCKKKIRP